MLEQTFIHISGVGPRTEQGIWAMGIYTWRAFLDHKGPIPFPKRYEGICREVAVSMAHRTDAAFFSARLPTQEMWRLFEAFKHRAVYLDIETTGGWGGLDEITVIGIYDGVDVLTFVDGINLDDFETAVAAYDLVITYNGAAFDLPHIRRRFPGISLPPAQIDLRFVLKRLGYGGGLKKIEKDLGISREAGIEGMDGYDAVRLWQAYRWGDQAALDTLIRYNRADIVNLKPLMEFGYKEMKARLLGRKD